MGATGEVTMYSSAGRTAKKFNRDPLPKGVYTGIIHTAKCSVEKKDQPGSVPYINGVWVECLNTGTDGGKNRGVYHSFRLGTDPQKDGVSAVDRADGLLGLAQALGVELNAPQQVVDKAVYDDKGEQTGELVKANILEPRAVKAWLLQLDGSECKVMVRVKPASKEYEAKNVIDYFVVPEASEGSTEETEVGYTAEETAPAEEPPPPPPPAKKAPSKAAPKGRR